MFLKKLELQGFKSFASKTIIDFPEGITAIVGPNGSGKSNISDAIRWLLGERESKTLRGARSNDLIFAGTEKRARSGFAQASIYFDNSSGFFPVEYKEIVVTRRVDRDNDSKFLLNQAEVRLKDIIDFFARGKLGARGLNIISQGESDYFLRATPQERRVLIEEILGLKEFLLKKKSAERELYNTKVNLEKSKIMLEEIKPRVKMLRRQAEKYIERDKLSSELRELENIFYGVKTKEISEKLSCFEPEIIAMQISINEKKKELTLLEEELKRIELSEPEEKKNLEELRIKRRKLLNERFLSTSSFSEAIVVKNKKSPLVLISEIKNLASAAMSYSSFEDLRGVLKKIILLIEEIEEKTEIISLVSEQSINKNVDAKSEAFNKMLDELDLLEKQLTSKLDGFNTIFRGAIKAIESKKDEIKDLEDKNEKIYFEKEKIQYRKTELEHQLSAIGKTFNDFVDLKEINDCNLDLLSAERKIYKLRNELASIGDIDESIIKEFEETEEKYQSSVLQIEELEKASVDLKSLIKELDYKISHDFFGALKNINEELSDFSKSIFGGGKIFLKLEENIAELPENNSDFQEKGEVFSFTNNENEEELRRGIEIELSLPKKKIKGIEALSGGERSLLSTAILFGLISISPPPFIVLDEVDAALDERNARKLGEMFNRLKKTTQFVIITHNRATMELADTLYGVTMGEDDSSRIISLKLS